MEWVGSQVWEGGVVVTRALKHWLPLLWGVKSTKHWHGDHTPPPHSLLAMPSAINTATGPQYLLLKQTSNWQMKQSGSLSAFSAGFPSTVVKAWLNIIKEARTKQLPGIGGNAIFIFLESFNGDFGGWLMKSGDNYLLCVFWALSWVRKIAVEFLSATHENKKNKLYECWQTFLLFKPLLWGSRKKTVFFMSNSVS